MIETIIKHKFNYRDKVIHITNGSPTGTIIDISWSLQSRQVKYFVVFSVTSQDWYLEVELKLDGANKKRKASET